VLGFLGQREQIWRLRYALVKGGIAHKELQRKREEIDNHIKDLNNVLNIQQRYQINLRGQIASLEKKILEKDLDPKIGLLLKNQLSALQNLAERRFEYTSGLSEMELMDRRVLGEIDSTLRKVSLKQRFSNISGYFVNIWDFELWVIDNRPVTVRKLVVALFILIIGIIIAKIFFRYITNRLLSRTQIKETTASAVHLDAGKPLEVRVLDSKD
jgi:hypothetical protein